MKAVFLDRDGVINRYPGDKAYVTSWRKFSFLPGAKKALAKLAQHGFRIFVVSNQAGVGKGIFSHQTLKSITRRMLNEIEASGGRIEQVYYCTHRPEAGCRCRKPEVGSLHRAHERYRIAMKHTFFIGDTIRDVQTARAAGCRSILVFSGREKPANRRNWNTQPDFCFQDLKEAADFLIRRFRR